MLTSSIRPAAALASNIDGRPAPKRARGEALAGTKGEAEGNKVPSRLNGKRARDVSLNSPLSPFQPNNALLQPAPPPRAAPEHVGPAPTRRSTRAGVIGKAPSSIKVCS